MADVLHSFLILLFRFSASSLHLHLTPQDSNPDCVKASDGGPLDDELAADGEQADGPLAIEDGWHGEQADELLAVEGGWHGEQADELLAVAIQKGWHGEQTDDELSALAIEDGWHLAADEQLPLSDARM